MSELLDDLWTHIVADNHDYRAYGICDRILHDYTAANWRRQDPLPHCKESLAKILSKYSPEQIREASEQVRLFTSMTPAEWDRRNRGVEPITSEERADKELAECLRAEREQAAEKARQEAIERQQATDAEAAEKVRQRSEYERAAWPIIDPKQLLTSNPTFQRRAEYDTSALDAALLRDYPGVRPDAIRLLIAAMGTARTSPATDPPIVLLNGENGSGKTHSVLLAANIACTTASEMPGLGINKSVCALQAEFCNAAESHALLFMDELDGLTHKPRLSSHLPCLARGKAYGWQGDAGTITDLVPVILACKYLHPVFWQDRALARRIVRVDLGRGAVGHNWSVNPVQGWRSKNADAADGLVSEMLDRFFREPRPWEQIVRELGFSFLTAHREQQVRDFAAALPVPSKASPVHGPGWRMVVPRRGNAATVARFDQLKQVLIDEGCAVVLPRSGERRTFICFPPPFLLEQEGASGGKKEGLTCNPATTSEI